MFAHPVPDCSPPRLASSVPIHCTLAISGLEQGGPTASRFLRGDSLWQPIQVQIWLIYSEEKQRKPTPPIVPNRNTPSVPLGQVPTGSTHCRSLRDRKSAQVLRGRTYGQQGLPGTPGLGARPTPEAKVSSQERGRLLLPVWCSGPKSGGAAEPLLSHHCSFVFTKIMCHHWEISFSRRYWLKLKSP